MILSLFARLQFAAQGGETGEAGERRVEAAATGRDGRADFSEEDPSGDANGSSSGDAGGKSSGDEGEDEGERTFEDVYEDEYKENIYKGILWMKEKYEQYRDLADERYERLKEQLSKVEKKYEDLVAAIGRSETGSGAPVVQASMGQEVRDAVQDRPDAVVAVVDRPEADEPWGPDPEFVAPLVQIVETAAEREVQTRIVELEEQFARERQRLEEEIAHLRYSLEEEGSRSRRQLDEQSAESRRQLELHMQHSNRQLEEKQRIIAELEGQLRSDRQKIEELVAKLRHNSQLLLNIYQELEKSL